MKGRCRRLLVCTLISMLFTPDSEPRGSYPQVGMNISTVSRQGVGRGSGVNFSLPADLLRDIVPKLIVYGNASGMRV